MAILLLGLVGCSSLSLAYNQLPLLGGLWADRYLDLDSGQKARLKDRLQAWQAWHRREELPQWQALLRQAQAALEGGITPQELLALERGARASAERSLQRAAPLAAPLLAELRPEQWQHLQKTLDEKTAEWREKQTGDGAADERGKRYTKNLERWLGDLDRPTGRQARADAAAWRFDMAAMAQGRATRQARTVEALRAWSSQDLAGGTAALMRNMQPLPVEQPYRDEVMASVLKLLNGLDEQQRERVRMHWAKWAAELRSLQAG
ncbi:MAG: DUF6279 family lipoprotein [Roseateles sp.]|uniref:DUF6279 family lipoprotein n=1 Tax=Roseateles sp. TaxID=1971397 RepID=UPI004037A606